MATQTLAMTDALEDKILNHIFRLTASATPGATHLALFTAMAAPEAGTVTEVGAGVGYARQPITFSAPTTNGTARRIASSGTITFGPNTTTNWGTIVGVGIYDLITGGVLLMYCTGLSTPVVVGESVTVQSTTLTVDLD